MGELIDKVTDATIEAVVRAKLAMGEHGDEFKQAIGDAGQELKAKAERAAGEIKADLHDKL